MILAFLAAQAESPNPIMPAANELFWGLVSFTALYLIVGRVLLRPVERTINDRRATIEANRTAANRARTRTAEVETRLAELVAEANRDAAAVVDRARAEAEAERRRLIERAEREVRALRDVTEHAIAEDVHTAFAELRPEIAQLAAVAASRIISHPVDIDTIAPLVDQHLVDEARYLR